MSCPICEASYFESVFASHRMKPWCTLGPAANEEDEDDDESVDGDEVIEDSEGAVDVSQAEL